MSGPVRGRMAALVYAQLLFMPPAFICDRTTATDRSCLGLSLRLGADCTTRPFYQFGFCQGNLDFAWSCSK
ncbi:uncharacterized protein BDW70DRAFT_131471 [Aspergillus foveolatus]|uniref:uncharacterized protein n=1 Tax=Aspergillus foveolatus TaxID=210207 RepID=UPI003CCDF38E